MTEKDNSFNYVGSICGGAIFTVSAVGTAVSCIDYRFNQAATEFITNHITTSSVGLDLAVAVPGMVLGAVAQYWVNESDEHSPKLRNF